jgi:LysR family glycine cleavage system transcriptional activator
MSLTQQWRRQPSLIAVRAFEAAGRLGSFTKAANELGLTQSAISRHVRGLEDFFGRSLFNRRGRTVELTDEGFDYLQEVSSGLDRIRRAGDRVARYNRPQNRVTLSMLPSVASLWLAPRLSEFTDAEPQIDLRLHASRALIDFDRDDVDLAVRYGMGDWPETNATLLAREILFPVCSPTLAERFKLSEDEGALTKVPLLVDDTPGGWGAWLNCAGLKPEQMRFGATFDESSGLYGAATANAGVALGRSLLVHHSIASGVLVRISARAIPAPYSYWLVSSQRAVPNKAAIRLEQWLTDVATQDAHVEPG